MGRQHTSYLVKKYLRPVGKIHLRLPSFYSLSGEQRIFIGSTDSLFAVTFVAECRPNTPKRDSQLTSQGIRSRPVFSQLIFHKRRLPKGFAAPILPALLRRAVVQLGRTLEWGSRGRGFESRRPDHFYFSVSDKAISGFASLFHPCSPEQSRSRSP